MTTARNISLTIDGRRCAGTPGQTILEVARAHDIYIPTLCYLHGLTPWGGCRMCIVEVAGNPKVVPACATAAVDGARVTTRSERLVRLRRATLELLFSERNHICPICPYNKGDCGLQHQGYLHGIDHVRYRYLYPALPVDLSGRFFGLDHNRCILCTRCVRTCDEVEGVHALDVAHRGIHNRVVVDFDRKFGESETCTVCGACVVNCPTGALFDKAAAFRGPLASCRQVLTTCTECPVGCGLKVFTKENRIVTVWGDPDAPVNGGHLCVKGRYETWALPRERILTPLLRREGGLTQATWPEALAAVRAALRASAPAERALWLLPRLTHEAADAVARVAGRFDRVGMAAANQEAALLAEPQFSPGALSRLREADAILVLGAQPSRDNGVVAARIRQAVRKRGAKLIVLHTRKSDLDGLADLCANVVGLEHPFWERVAALLAAARRPALVYGPGAMTPIGVTILERLIQILETHPGGEAPLLLGLPVCGNGLPLAAVGVEAVEELGPWLDAKPLRFLHVVASDAPEGGAEALEERHVAALLERIDCLVVQASYRSRLTERAQVVLPTLTWWEKSGTITNVEGRRLPLRPVLSVAGEAREDKTVLEEIFA